MPAYEVRRLWAAGAGTKRGLAPDSATGGDDAHQVDVQTADQQGLDRLFCRDIAAHRSMLTFLSDIVNNRVTGDTAG